MRRRKVQAGGIGKALEIYRLFVTRQRVERVHHSLDDLNRGLAIGFGHDFFRSLEICAMRQFYMLKRLPTTAAGHKNTPCYDSRLAALRRRLPDARPASA